jgi:hypothetical protein
VAFKFLSATTFPREDSVPPLRMSWFILFFISELTEVCRPGYFRQAGLNICFA